MPIARFGRMERSRALPILPLAVIAFACASKSSATDGGEQTSPRDGAAPPDAALSSADAEILAGDAGLGSGDSGPNAGLDGGPASRGACGPGAGTSGPLVAGGLTALPDRSRLGPNLVLNGGFENGGPAAADGWDESQAWSRDTSEHHSGAASIRLRDAPSAPYTQIAQQTIQLHRGIYKISGWIKAISLGANTNGSGVRLNLDFSVGAGLERGTSEVVGGTFEWMYQESDLIIVPDDREAKMMLEAYGVPDGTAWFDDIEVKEVLPLPLDAFLLYPNYRGMMFEDQPGVIRLDIAIALPSGDLAAHRVVVTLEDEQTHDEKGRVELPASEHLVAELDGCTMAAGATYLLTPSLVTAAGAAVFAHPPFRLTRVPAEKRMTMNVTFDAQNHVLLHGRPRFILGVYDSGMGYVASEAEWEEQLWAADGERRMGGLAINMYLNYWYGGAPMTSMGPMMADLMSHGVMYLQTGNCVTSNPTGDQFSINSSDSYVAAFAGNPGAAGYYTADECSNAMIPSAFAQYQRLKRLDPSSITFSALLADPDLFLWRDAADVISTDPYPLYAAEPAGGYDHRMVADWTIRAREAVKGARPFMTVLQFFQFTSLGRWPTAAEMRSHAVMAIVEGAQGLWWWSLGDNALKDVCPSWCPEREQHMADLRSLVGDLASIEAGLLAESVAGAVRPSSSDIATLAKATGGKRYVLAYNGTSTPRSAIQIDVAPAPGAIDVLGEHRTIAPNASGFADDFGPFAGHIYIITP
jgi:hypothetical protein